VDYRFRIAARYLTGRRSFSLIGKITGISVAGVALGVAALIVVLSVMNGFFTFVRDMLVSFDPHVRIVSAGGRDLAGADSLLDLVADVPGVVSAAAYVEGKALLLHEGASEHNKVVIVRGVNAEASPHMADAVASTGFGRFSLERVGGRPGIVIGRQLGERLILTPAGGASPASRVSLLSSTGIERMITRPIGASPAAAFEVRGLYEMQTASDESYVFVDLPEAQRLFRTGGAVTGIDLRIADLEGAPSVRAALRERLADDRYEVLTWYDLKKSLYDVMQLEKWGAMVILLLIVVVAAFNIVGSLTMIVIEKQRDVGVLRAMGVSRRGIRQIFLAEGLFIGLAGSGLGTAVGLGLSVLQREYGLVQLSGAESFLIDAWPVDIQAGDVAIIGLLALLLCVAAALYPAWRASAIEPAKAVNLEG
jgi:lipoprotein-releasing system permease protein